MVVTSDKSNFDVQFEFGDMSQQKLVEVFTGEASTLEIKSERARNWSKTGNICIEYAYDRWNPESKERIQSKSGISTSTSAHWAQMLMLDDGSYGVMLVFPTTFLQSLIKKWWNTAKKIEVTRDSAVETTTVTRGKAYCMLMPIADIMVELQRTGGYYMENVTPYSNGRIVDRVPDEIIPFDPEGGEPPV